MNKILFSPIGDTDPIRDCYDGAMLHIVRYYQPEYVILYFTQEMEVKDKTDNRYELAIRHVAHQCKVKKIYTGIIDAHKYDSFLTSLPEIVYGIQKDFNHAKLLINLSSGTPQIKTFMAFFATELENAVGIQVASPMHGSNRKSRTWSDGDAVNTILHNNLDDVENINRCEEANLYAIRRYGIKQQILSLCRNYEYMGAYNLCKKHERLFKPVTLQLLQHAALREKMRLSEAEKVLSSYNGKQLFRNANVRNRRLIEFFLTMVLKQKKGQLPDFILKITPFLYNLAYIFVSNTLKFDIAECCTQKSNLLYLNPAKLKRYNERVFLGLETFYNGLKGGPLSFTSLLQIVKEIQKYEEFKDGWLDIVKLMGELRDIEKEIRNPVAHEIVEFDESLFKISNSCNASSELVVKKLRLLMEKVLGNEAVNVANVYDEINHYVESSMQI